jgi:hypothetical protein
MLYLLHIIVLHITYFNTTMVIKVSVLYILAHKLDGGFEKGNICIYKGR